MRCSRLIVFASTMLAFALSGCASPGFPRAPSLHLPASVTDLTATRIGDRVELRWTAPASTTDGLDVTFPTTVEVCRDPAGRVALRGEAPPPCTGVLKLAGHPGMSSAVDQLPSSLAGPQATRQVLDYRVRVLNPSGRAAAPATLASVPSGPPLEPVQAFHALQTKDGVLMGWSAAASGAQPGAMPADDGALVEVLRTDLTPKPAPPSRSGTASTTSPMPLETSLSHTHRAESLADVRLRPDASSAVAASPAFADGMIDRSVLSGATYSYRARRLLKVSSSGRTVEMFSEPTAPVTIAMRDTFPPAIPQGLASVPGSTGPPGSRPAIDLSWQPNSEVDLAGYHVYRMEVGHNASPEEGKGVRLTSSPVAGPAFRDTTVRPGHRYAYRVTSIDRSGNESMPSAPVQDSPEGR